MTGILSGDFALLFFYVSMGFMATHELDAIQRREWRLLFLGAPLDDVTAFRLFTVLRDCFPTVYGAACTVVRLDHLGSLVAHLSDRVQPVCCDPCGCSLAGAPASPERDE